MMNNRKEMIERIQTISARLHAMTLVAVRLEVLTSEEQFDDQIDKTYEDLDILLSQTDEVKKDLTLLSNGVFDNPENDSVDWGYIRATYEQKGRIPAIKSHREIFDTRLITSKNEVCERAQKEGWSKFSK